MACLRRHQSDLDGGAIAHFTDQNYFRRLTQRGAESGWIIIEIVTELALVKGGLEFRVNEFDWVLERDNVDGLGLIDLVEDASQSGRLSAAGGSGHQNESGFFFRHFTENLREAE